MNKLLLKACPPNRSVPDGHTLFPNPVEYTHVVGGWVAGMKSMKRKLGKYRQTIEMFLPAGLIAE